MNNDQVTVMFASEEHTKYADLIVKLIYESALQRGTGIARRSPQYIIDKIKGGKAVVALYGDQLIGFSYIESWSHGDYVATSGLIVDPEFRKLGLAGRIKNKTFELARRRFPYAKIFSITTSLPVMKLNSRLRTYPGRRILEGLRRMQKLRHPVPQQPPHVPLLRHALRPQSRTREAIVDYSLHHVV